MRLPAEASPSTSTRAVAVRVKAAIPSSVASGLFRLSIQETKMIGWCAETSRKGFNPEDASLSSAEVQLHLNGIVVEMVAEP